MLCELDSSEYARPFGHNSILLQWDAHQPLNSVIEFVFSWATQEKKNLKDGPPK